MSAPDLAISLGDVADSAMLDARPLLHEIFERRAAQDPEALAVRFEDLEVSYRELNAHANRLARFLGAQGVGPQDKVGIWLEPGYERVAALLGVLKLGAVACPLHLSLPAKLLSSIAEKIGVKALLTSSAALEKCGTMGVAIKGCLIIDVPASRAALAAHGDRDLGQRVDWRDLAYIVHTSGSTGEPKAVAMTHKAFSYEIRWQIRQSGSSRAPTTLQFSSLGFDVFLTEIMATLCEGGLLVVATEQVRNSSASLLDAINQERVQRLLISRVVLQGLAEEVVRRGQPPSSLKEIMCTGEQLTITPEIRELFKRHSCLLYNEYGMSESPVVAAHVLDGDPDAWPAVCPVGRVAPGSEVFILDDDLRRVPPGEAGEVYVAGNFLANGYLGADEESAEKFRANPFGPGLMFKSGDVGRFSPENELLLLGRLDSVVKIRGIRIGLGEIEAVLRNHPSVRESAVLKLEDDRDARLVAYVSLKERSDSYESSLREWLAEHLPSYAMPAQFVEMEAFPKTHSGKIDRRALPAPSMDRPKIATAYAPAASRLETQLLNLWKNVLKVGSIGVKDKIFDLGGTSLSMQELLRQINRELSINLAATDLLRFPSIEALATHISSTHLGISDIGGALQVREEEVDYLDRRRRRRRQLSLAGEASDEKES